MAILTLAASLVPFASSASAQIVRGVVIEAESRTPIVGAEVELIGDRERVPARATSDSLGLFVLAVPRAGVYTIQARRLGFQTADPVTIRIGASETISVELRLGARAVPLEPVVVTVRGDEWLTGFERRKAAGFGRFIDRKDIESRAPMRTTDLFRLMPGLVLRAQQRGRVILPGSVLLMRGTAGYCQPAVWIDGLYVALSGTGTTLDDLLTPQSIEAIEIYNSVASAPTQYRTGTCGVVLFWTRRGSREEGERFQWKKVAGGVGAVILFLYLIR